MMTRFNNILVLACLGVFVPQSADAQSSTTGAEIARVVFSELEKQIMERYFGVDSTAADEGTVESSNSQGKGKGKKDGKKKKKKKLPPGLSKRKELPPGLAKRELPGGLKQQLPASAPGTERVIIEGSVVLIEKATSKVLDILENVVLGGQ